jgi:two-component system, chemotaxis family, chemotaxis protein CheY
VNNENSVAVGRSEQPRPTVLIVDDDPGIRDGLGEFLAEEGFTVSTASEGVEALKILSTGMKPVAILLDVMMPPMDGWDFRQRQLIDETLAEIPTIVISAAGFSADSIRAQFGDVEFLPKPIPVLTLLKALREAAGSRG